LFFDRSSLTKVKYSAHAIIKLKTVIIIAIVDAVINSITVVVVVFDVFAANVVVVVIVVAKLCFRMDCRLVLLADLKPPE